MHPPPRHCRKPVSCALARREGRTVAPDEVRPGGRDAAVPPYRGFCAPGERRIFAALFMELPFHYRMRAFNQHRDNAILTVHSRAHGGKV